MKRQLCFLAACMVMASPMAFAQDDAALAAVEQQIVSTWESLDSATADLSVRMRLDAGEMSLPATASGRAEYTKKEEKGLFRGELNGALTATIADNSAELPINLLTVFDGDLVQTMTTFMLQQVVLQSEPPTEELGAAGRALFDTLHKDCTLALMPEQTVNGKDSYVIEAKVNKPSSDDIVRPARLIFHFAKDTGIPVKVVGYDTADSAILVVDLKNVKVNMPLNLARFNFAPPQGAKVITGDENWSQLLPVLPTP